MILKDTSLRNLLCKYFRQLYHLGLNTSKSGNISVKIGNSMLISPSGIPALEVSSEKLVEMNLATGTVTKSQFYPSTEWLFHQEIYRSRKNFNAIVHTHSPNATALSCLESDLPPFHYMLANFGTSSIKCARYETFGTSELSLAIRDAIRGSKACFLANHGAIAAGESIKEAFENAVLLEELAKIYLISISVGKPRILPEGEMQALNGKFKTYGKDNEI